MPTIVRHYIIQTAIGFALAAVFVAMLLYFDIVGLRRLIFGSDVGVLALFLLWFFNGIVFAGVQFGVSIMFMAEDDDDDDEPPSGGTRDRIAIPIPVEKRRDHRQP